MEGPNHIAFILDGNRRYAEERNMHPWKGHEKGAEKLEEVLQWCKDEGFTEATLYAFSVQNFKRSEKEKSKIFSLFERYTDKLMRDKKFQNNDHQTRIRFLGRTEMLPESLRNKMKEIEVHTKDNDKYSLNVCIGYGGRSEILDAVKEIVSEVEEGNLSIEDITSEVFESKLYLESSPDMIIRTGGRVRTSNFLPWQSVYSEWFFLDEMWPEFSKEKLLECVRDFKDRTRNFGK